MNPSISVVMSFFNDAAHVQQAIDSILSQDFSDFELVVINDGSTDNSEDVVLHAQRYDSRIKYIGNTQGIGLTQALIAAINSTSGKYIARQDADDFSMRTRLSEQFRFLESNMECVMVGTARFNVDTDGNILKAPKVIFHQEHIRRLLPYGNIFTHGATMFRRAAYYQAGGYDPGFRYAQDFDLWLRMSKVGLMENLPSRLYAWRQTGTSISSKKKVQQSIYAALAAIRHADLCDQRALVSLLDKLKEIDVGETSEKLFFDFLKRANSGRIWSITGNVFMRCGERQLAIQSWQTAGSFIDKFKALASRKNPGFHALKKIHLGLGLPSL